MALPREMYGDPERWLTMRGEDCTNCKHLAPWSMGGKTVTVCDNQQAPEKKRKAAPASRCHKWEHKQQEAVRAK